MLQIEQLEVGYGGVPVLRGVSLRVAENESVAIVGANGAGKSTLVAALCGLLLPSGGRILKQGKDITAVPAHQRAQMGIAVVLEGRHLFGELSVRDNLSLAAIYAAKHARAMQNNRTFSMDDVLKLFPFMRERLGDAVELLSGGEQQMVALGRALLLQPDLLILDEPSTGLSPLVVKQIMATIQTLRERGMSILLVEQNVALAAQIAERAYVMSVGQIVHEVAKGEWQNFIANEELLKAYLGT